MPREERLQEWQRAAKEKPAKGLAVACRLATINRWDGDVWQATLVGLKDSGLHLPVFRRVAPFMIGAPSSFFTDRGTLYDVCWAVASLMYATTGRMPAEQEELFWGLWSRVAPVAFADVAKRVDGPSEEDDESTRALRDNDAVTAAINDPAGILTQCLLGRLDARRPKAGAGLPAGPVTDWLTTITDGAGLKHRFGRIVLARSLPIFHAIDPSWAEEHLLRRFDWSMNVNDASAVWFAYLTSGVPGSPDLFFALRDQLTGCIDHEKDLGNAFEQCWQLIVFAAFEIPNAFATGQVKRLLRRSKSGRQKAAFAIWRYMPEDKPGEPPRSADYWRTRVGPWISAEWPQDKDMRTGEVSEHLALAALQAGEQFPDALRVIAPFLVPISGHSFLLHRVLNSDHPEDHPESTLSLMSAVIDTRARSFLVDDLRGVLDRIAKAHPACRDYESWKSLNEFVVASGRV